MYIKIGLKAFRIHYKRLRLSSQIIFGNNFNFSDGQAASYVWIIFNSVRILLREEDTETGRDWIEILRACEWNWGIWFISFPYRAISICELKEVNQRSNHEHYMLRLLCSRGRLLAIRIAYVLVYLYIVTIRFQKRNFYI